MWAQFARAEHCVAGGGWEGVMGGFEGGLGFNDAAGGVCKSMCIAVVVVLGYPARMVALSLLVLVLTVPFFDSISGLLFDLWYPLTNLLFGLVLCCGRIVHRFIEDWHGGGFSGYGGHWDIDEWCGVCDGDRDLVG